MVMEEKFLGQLRDHFDLNLYEVKIWTALLSRGISTAGELSDIANVPRSRAYDVLESLERKGFVVMKLGKPIKYIAVQPDEVMERVKKNYKESAMEKASDLEKLKDSEVVMQLKQLYEKGIEMIEPTELSGALKGRHNLHDHIDLLIKDATKEISIVTSVSEINRLAEFHFSSLKEAKARGVKIRIAAEITAENFQSAKTLLELSDLKYMDHIRARFYIIDGEEVLFMLLPEEEVHPTYDTGIWVHSPFFASAMEDLLDHAWSKLDDSEKYIKKIEAKSK
jgi:HTH-type transcriptional regulator, sugar sensing transcriptional regulator